MSRLIIAVPPGETRKLLIDFFSPLLEVVSLEREHVIDDQQLALTDNEVSFQGQNILQGTTGAIILDSGFMTPLPGRCPPQEQWDSLRGRFDPYLRTDRERESFWYSTLAILNEELPWCCNTQSAFAAGEMKPWALMSLMDASVPTLPFVATNSRADVSAFFEENGGTCRLLPWTRDDEPTWLNREEADRLPLDREPVILQAGEPQREAVHVHILGGKIFPTRRWNNEPLELGQVERQVYAVQETLAMEWGEVWLLPWKGTWSIADYSPAPRLEDLAPETARALLNELWATMRAAGQDASGGPGAGSLQPGDRP